MTTACVGSPSAASATAGRYSVVLTRDRADIEAAQRLRYQVFSTEPGFTLGAFAAAIERDVDRFDTFCDHILVRDRVTGDAVGCYRLLPPEGARALGGPYTATEFDLDALAPILPGAVELGRACVHPDHRSGAVSALLWSGILRYLSMTDHSWLVGCVSVPMRSTPGERPGANVRAVRDVVSSRYAHDPRWQVRPHRPVRVDGRGLDEIEPAARAVLPPLLRAYLRIGARVCGEPAHDPEFGVADFVVLLGAHHADQRYLDRFLAATGAA
ncbi:GNAT family N-acetyltransferase [Rhodococcus sp. D2-41]|uniref:GNAT family N-acetyltransferase n=1 Tax=Speluncibacter jeojiensis TaxID=2710754 RepID=A0A9X4RG98_9ACTN|nr:GNAT family N-acyltransferase [Rhodococcus sp. D2-41]MDG3012790.1 GNAT family N-acetyltransferase [Rhodococcus sp. D2-41]MDG3017107.1 GNAT family N-acetyltransferase [Corynebacteriales bacterium D3-21]